MTDIQKQLKNRDLSIDFFRGIAALGIILHHSASYSDAGKSIPYLIAVTMVVEVPAFFYLSGATFHYTNGIRQYLKRIIHLMISYVIFSFIYICFITLFDYFTQNQSIQPLSFFTNWLKMSLFRGTDHHFFAAVNSSMWFMPLYFKIMFIYAPLLLLIRKMANKLSGRFRFASFKLNTNHLVSIIVITTIFLSIFLHLQMQSGYSYPFLQIQVIFYGIFFLSGYLSFFITIKHLHSLIGLLFANLLLLWAALVHYQGNITQMLSYKFPPHMIFLLFSSFFLIITLYLKKLHFSERNLIVKIGQNSIWFFYAQGFSTAISSHLSSFLRFPEGIFPEEIFPLGMKFLFTFLLNLLLCIPIALLLRTLIGLISRPFHSIMQKIGL